MTSFFSRAGDRVRRLRCPLRRRQRTALVVDLANAWQAPLVEQIALLTCSGRGQSGEESVSY